MQKKEGIWNNGTSLDLKIAQRGLCMNTVSSHQAYNTKQISASIRNSYRFNNNSNQWRFGPLIDYLGDGNLLESNV